MRVRVGTPRLHLSGTGLGRAHADPLSLSLLLNLVLLVMFCNLQKRLLHYNDPDVQSYDDDDDDDDAMRVASKCHQQHDAHHLH